MENFGERLATLRKERGMSQEDLAEKLQLTRQTISNWETGASTPDISFLVSLAEVFEVSVDSLLGRSASHQKEKAKDPFLAIFCLFQLTIFVAGVVLYIWKYWAYASLGLLFMPWTKCVVYAMISLPPLIIIGIGIARYKAWRKTKK